VRVAIDEQIFAIQRYGGISRMFAELARQFVVNGVGDVDLLPFDAPVVNRYLLDHPEVGGPLGARQARSEWTALARYLTRPGTHPDCDIVHNTFYLPHGLAPVRGAKRVVTVHDMIPERLPQTRRRLDWLTLKQRYVRHADHIVCVSEATRRDLVDIYGADLPPITIVHHGVDERFHPGVPRLDFLPERYVLFVGNRDQYKDARVLFEAFAALAARHPDLHLLCVGGAGLTPAEVAWLKERGIRERVSQRYLSDADMASAYAHAEVFVFPSRFEGFGLPALEAMASGTPAILAEATSLPEVGGDAALYFDPGDVEQLCEQIDRVLTDEALSGRLVACGLERAGSFTWGRAAERTAEVYRTALQ
jgi:glycosyltransferase involved in cell wall biosynthesis